MAFRRKTAEADSRVYQLARRFLALPAETRSRLSEQFGIEVRVEQGERYIFDISRLKRRKPTGLNFLHVFLRGGTFLGATRTTRDIQPPTSWVENWLVKDIFEKMFRSIAERPVGQKKRVRLTAERLRKPSIRRKAS